MDNRNLNPFNVEAFANAENARNARVADRRARIKSVTRFGLLMNLIITLFFTAFGRR